MEYQHYWTYRISGYQSLAQEPELIFQTTHHQVASIDVCRNIPSKYIVGSLRIFAIYNVTVGVVQKWASYFKRSKYPPFNYVI